MTSKLMLTDLFFDVQQPKEDGDCRIHHKMIDW